MQDFCPRLITSPRTYLMKSILSIKVSLSLFFFQASTLLFEIAVKVIISEILPGSSCKQKMK